MNQEINYKANVEMKSHGSFLSTVEKIKRKFDDIKITNIITITKDYHFSFDIEIKTDIHASFCKEKIKNVMFGEILRTIFFESLAFKELKEEAEIYALN